MNISKKCVVSFHYTLTDGSGKVLETTEGQEPMVYLHGADNIMPSLEKALSGKTAGDKLHVSILAAEAFGLHNDAMVQELPLDMFSNFGKLEVGMEFDVDTTGHGEQIAVITKIDGDKVYLDGNHELAGVDLTYDIEITDVRAASEDEIKHRHAHGAGGHHH